MRARKCPLNFSLRSSSPFKPPFNPSTFSRPPPPPPPGPGGGLLQAPFEKPSPSQVPLRRTMMEHAPLEKTRVLGRSAVPMDVAMRSSAGIVQHGDHVRCRQDTGFLKTCGRGRCSWREKCCSTPTSCIPLSVWMSTALLGRDWLRLHPTLESHHASVKRPGPKRFGPDLCKCVFITTAKKQPDPENLNLKSSSMAGLELSSGQKAGQPG